MNKKFYLVLMNVVLALILMGGASIASDAQTVNIHVNPHNNLCVGDSMTLSRTATGFGGLSTTTYYKNNILIFTGNVYTKGNLMLSDSGIYKVRVMDQSGLTDEDTIKINVNLIPKYDSITVVDPPTCGGNGSFTIWGLLKERKYTLYFKYNNEDEISDEITTDAEGKLINGMLLVGKYSEIQVKLNNCTSDVAFDSVFLKDPPLPITSLMINQEICQGDTLSFVGNPAPGTLTVLSGDGNVISNGTKLTTKPNGVAPIVVEYSYQDPTTLCVGKFKDTITINQLPVFTADPDSVKCNGGNDGKITITPNFQNYTWSIPGLNGNEATNLISAEYSVTVTDNKGCKSKIQNIWIAEPAALVASNVQDRVICFETPEFHTVQANGGTSYYIYDWEGPGLSGDNSTINFAEPGEYFLTITDFNKCTILDTILVKENSEIIITLTAGESNYITNHFCDGNSITLEASGEATFQWMDGPSTNFYEVFESGFYTVNATRIENQYSCNINKSITVIKDTLPIISFEETLFENKGYEFKICEGSILPILVNDSLQKYNYQWFDGDNKAIKEFTKDTSYKITVTDATTGCFDTSSFKIIYHDIVKVKIFDSGGLDFNEVDTVCVNGKSIILNLNGEVNTFNNPLTYWYSSDSNFVDITSTGNKRQASIIVGNGDFTLYVSTHDRNLGCLSRDSIKFYILGPETNITEISNCGLILLKNNYQLDPIPVGVIEIGNGFYFIKDSAKLSYIFEGECRDTMEVPIINPQNGLNYKLDNLIFDECGPFLLAKHSDDLCYTWYKIDTLNQTHEIIQTGKKSWYKLKKDEADNLDKNNYVAIGYDCQNSCDSTQISTRSAEDGKTIPCYNSGDGSINIYPNPNQGYMYLKLEGLPAGKQKVLIYNIMGQLVYNEVINHTGSNDVKELSLTHLPDGIYFARTDYNGQDISTKFIITH